MNNFRKDLLSSEQTRRTAMQRLRRTLVRRITVAASVVALIVAGAVYLVQIKWINATVFEQARTEAETFFSLLEAEQPEKDISRLLSKRANQKRDHFVFIELYRADETMVAEAAPTDFASIEETLDRRGHPFPELGRGSRWSRRTTINGRTLVQVIVPVKEKDNTLKGYFEGVYEVSGTTMGNIRRESRRSGMVAVVGVLVMAGVLYPVARQQQRRLADGAVDLLNANLGTLKVLGNAIAKRDSDTHTHNYRVSLYAAYIGEEMKLDSGKMRALIKGAFVHDVGKIGVQDAVLLKKGRLSDAEFDAIKEHARYGYEIVRDSAWLKEASDVVLSHHEKVDGTGYPSGLQGKNIPLTARVFAVADVFDALTSRRPYKEPFSLEKATEILEEGRDTHFDGRILDVFMPKVEAVFNELADYSEEDVEARLDTVIARHFPLTV